MASPSGLPDISQDTQDRKMPRIKTSAFSRDSVDSSEWLITKSTFDNEGVC